MEDYEPYEHIVPIKGKLMPKSVDFNTGVVVYAYRECSDEEEQHMWENITIEHCVSTN